MTEARSLDPIETHPTDPSSRLAELASQGGRRRTALVVFALIALTIALGDQLLKQWVLNHYAWETPTPVVGDWFRIHLIQNGGGLFGLFQGTAWVFALVTIGVVGVLLALEIGSGWRSWLVTLTLSLLLGGAIGNFIDRNRLGYVVDFADIGIGSWRFYIFNLADSAVTVAIILMFVLWFVAPHLGVHMPAEGDGGSGKKADEAGAVTTSTKGR
jgi:signal peptidase II